MEKITELILKKHKIIKDNQNAKQFVLRRLINPIDIEIKKLTNELISDKKLVLERNEINDAYNKQKYKKYRRIKVPMEQRRLET